MSAPAMDIDVRFDPFDLAALAYKAGPALYEKALTNLQKDATLVGDAAAKRATPVKTGHARRSAVADTRRMVVEGRYPYLNWLDVGTDCAGRTMRKPRGGYQIRSFTRDAVNAAIPTLLDRAGREIARRWGE